MTLHPQAERYLNEIREQSRPSWPELPPEESRRLFASLGDVFGVGPEMSRVENRVVSNHIPVRIYWPKGKDDPEFGAATRGGPEQIRDTATRPIIVYFHGGGWVLGDLDTHDSLCRRLASASDCVVMAVDYRRSPEHVFPAGFEDCFHATRYAVAHAGELGARSDRVIVAGDSAGGNLAAAVALHATRSRAFELFFQLLIYPVIDPKCDTESYERFADGFGLTAATMRWFWDQYVGAGEIPEDELVCPLMAGDLSDLPAAHILTAEYDVLRDEGEHYAQKLREAGVEVSCKRYPGAIHGFLHSAGIFEDGRTAMVELGDVIASRLS